MAQAACRGELDPGVQGTLARPSAGPRLAQCLLAVLGAGVFRLIRSCMMLPGSLLHSDGFLWLLSAWAGQLLRGGLGGAPGRSRQPCPAVQACTGTPARCSGAPGTRSAATRRSRHLAQHSLGCAGSVQQLGPTGCEIEGCKSAVWTGLGVTPGLDTLADQHAHAPCRKLPACCVSLLCMQTILQLWTQTGHTSPCRYRSLWASTITDMACMSAYLQKPVAEG